MNDKLLKPYDSSSTEQRIYEVWEKSGYFNPDNLPQDTHPKSAAPFTIIMPPPNANGRLHAGHGLAMTMEDAMIRFNRMRGRRALWVPGADHAGFETQIVYEKKLEKEGRSRFEMEPQHLYDEILAFTLENKQHMENDVRRLGASCDWSREKFTLDPKIVKTVQQTFQKMYDDQLIYRGNRIVNWCPKHQTSLSDVETEFKDQTDTFYYFKYGPFTIGTSRPETKFGDKYVVMHPDDERYKDYHDGQQLQLEWINGPITATVLKDRAVDMEFGTGVMTITPWHDAVDFEIAERHQLNREQIIDWKGKLLPIAGEFAGQHISKARAAIVEKMRAKGLVVKEDTNYQHAVKVCYKCGTPIEPQIKEQWFVKMKPLAALALEAVNSGKIKFIPDNYEKIFRYWMENTIDWNISRQIVWGIPIPAKLCQHCHQGYADVENKMLTCPVCKNPLIHDPDTFDTWFSSGQWTLLALGYPDSPDLNIYHPSDVMETGHDLIFKWIPRMVIFAEYLRKEVPFHTVYLHGLVNDSQGKKMSKSKGNVVSPIDMADKYGADALRMSLIVGNAPGHDLPLLEPKIKGYKNFANKLWNITRFILTNAETADLSKQPKLHPVDQSYLEEFKTMLADVTSDFENLRFHLAPEKIYHYVWDILAAKIIEESKPRLNGDNETEKESARYTLLTLLINSVKILHPFMPFVTEEIWSMLPHGEKNLLLVATWPKL